MTQEERRLLWDALESGDDEQHRQTCCVGYMMLVIIAALVLGALWLWHTQVADAYVGSGMPSIQLHEGYSMVGWPLLVSKPLPDAFGACWPLVTMIWSYDAADAADPWENYDIAVPPFLNDLTELRYGHGYWVQVSADCAWMP
jgi:hypothetical protein